MKAVQSIYCFLIGGMFLFFASVVAAAPTLPPPEAVVERFTRDLLKTFDQNKDSYRKTPESFFKEVDRLLSPVVAFDQVASYVMGKYSRRSPGAAEKFEPIFKESLIRFYGKALLALDDTKLSIDDVESTSADMMKKYASGGISRIPVKMKVRTSNRSVDMYYSMVHTGDRWKLRNITIDGINIAKLLQTRFAEAVNEHKKVDYVVDNWANILASKETGKK